MHLFTTIQIQVFINNMGAHVSKKNITITDINSDSITDIYFINYEKYKALGEFPRYPDNKDLAISFSDIPYDDSIIIFVSHGWFRSYKNDIGNRNTNHPDTINNDKYLLSIDGINKVLQNHAFGMTHCYLWIDYGCINQDNNDFNELMKLHLIMHCCDCIFTPIYEDNYHNNWLLPAYVTDFYKEYKAKPWIDGDNAYLNRAWCRIEMFLAANIPLKSINNIRLNKFNSGLKYHIENNRRPHILYGTYDQYHSLMPRILNPLQNIYYTRYNPLHGKLSNQNDIELIKEYINILKIYMKYKSLGYSGEYDINTLEKSGKGIYVYDDGSEYRGEYKDNKRNGKGKFIYSNGDIYNGNYLNDKRFGFGIFTYCCGDKYIGEWYNDKRNGKGKFIFADIKSTYDGEWKNDRKDGYGISVTDNEEYIGYFYNNMRNNKGILRFKNGDIYDGMFFNDCYHGYGILKTSLCNYEGEFINGIYQKKKI